MKIILFLLALVMGFPLLIFSGAAHADLSENIAVVVNSDAISQSDVNDRMRLIMVSSGLQDRPEIREKLIPQITSVLIDEQIKLQEAAKQGLEITPEEIEGGFKQLAEQNKFTPEQFKTLLSQGGINIATMHRQIKAQIAWNKVVAEKLRPQIQVRETDVDDAIARMKANVGKTEYLAAEIFLPVDSPADDANVRQLAARLSDEIRAQKAPFFQVARQFSQSAGASKGGDLGWVQESQLPPEVAEALPSLEVNLTSAPIRSLNGYHIILVREKRDIKEENIPGNQAVTNLLGQERLERLQRQHLLNLKSSAFVDSRV